MIVHKNGDYYFHLRQDFSLDIITYKENPKLEYPELIEFNYKDFTQVPYLDEIVAGTTVIINNVNKLEDKLESFIKELAIKHVFVLISLEREELFEEALDLFKYKNVIGVVYELFHDDIFKYASNTNKERKIITEELNFDNPMLHYSDFYKHLDILHYEIPIPFYTYISISAYKDGKTLRELFNMNNDLLSK